MADQIPKIPIPVRMRPTETEKVPSMWVLRGPNAEKNLRSWAEKQSEDMIGKLDYAVAEGSDGRPIVLIKSKRVSDAPSIDIPGARPMLPYSQSASNIYLPHDMRIPSVNQRAIRDLMGQSAGHISWSLPDEQQEAVERSIPESDWSAKREPMSFSTEMLHSKHFRPLSEYVSYRAPKTKQHKTAWSHGDNPFELQPHSVGGEERSPVYDDFHSYAKQVRDAKDGVAGYGVLLSEMPLSELHREADRLAGSRRWAIGYGAYDETTPRPIAKDPAYQGYLDRLVEEARTRESHGGPNPDRPPGSDKAMWMRLVPRSEVRYATRQSIAPESAPPTPSPVKRKPRTKKVVTVPKSTEPATKTTVATPQEYIPPASTNAEAMEQKKRLEQQMIDADGDQDSPEHQRLWPQIALANQAAGFPDQASIAWQNALWHNENDPKMIEAWAKSEKIRDPFKTIQDLIAVPHPSSAEANRFAAAIKLASVVDQSRLASISSSIAPWLERNQRLMGVKAAWLAVNSAHGKSGDTLGMAKNRDAIFDRLNKDGMTDRRDVPDFVQNLGGGSSTPTHYLSAVHGAIRDWFEKHAKNDTSGILTKNLPYVDMLSAIHLGNLGDKSHARELFERARDRLNQHVADTAASKGTPDPFADFHGWLSSVLAHRIDQVSRGEKISEPLPEHFSPKGATEALVYSKRKMLSDLHTAAGTSNLNRFRDSGVGEKIVPLESLSGEELFHGINRVLNSPEWKATGPKTNMIVNNVPNMIDLVNRLPVDKRPGLIRKILEKEKDLHDQPIDQIAKFSSAMIPQLANNNMNDAVSALADKVASRVSGNKNDGWSRDAAQYLLGGNFVRNMRKAGLGEQGRHIVKLIQDKVQGGQSLDEARDRHGKTGSTISGFKRDEATAAYMAIAKEHLADGDYGSAKPLLDHAHRILTTGDHAQGQSYENMLGRYMDAVGSIPDKQEATTRIADVLHKSKPVAFGSAVERAATSAAHLGIADKAIRSIAGDGGGLSEVGKGWMADSDYFTRRKIHSDMRQALDKAEL